eukprot:2213136-Rhodomonas_salina.1
MGMLLAMRVVCVRRLFTCSPRALDCCLAQHFVCVFDGCQHARTSKAASHAALHCARPTLAHTSAHERCRGNTAENGGLHALANTERARVQAVLRAALSAGDLTPVLRLVRLDELQQLHPPDA